MGLLSRRPSTPVGPFAELSKHSRFAYIEKLEFWPELDDDGRAWTSRESYPGDPWAYSRRVAGERVPPSQSRPAASPSTAPPDTHSGLMKSGGMAPSTTK